MKAYKTHKDGQFINDKTLGRIYISAAEINAMEKVFADQYHKRHNK